MFKVALLAIEDGSLNVLGYCFQGFSFAEWAESIAFAHEIIE